MQSSICFGQGWKLTSQTMREGVRCASRGAGQPESHCSLMRFPTGHGKSLAWISSTFKASLKFSFVIISQSSLTCVTAVSWWAGNTWLTLSGRVEYSWNTLRVVTATRFTTVMNTISIYGRARTSLTERWQVLFSRYS